jgi:hypothetical protein
LHPDSFTTEGAISAGDLSLSGSFGRQAPAPSMYSHISENVLSKKSCPGWGAKPGSFLFRLFSYSIALPLSHSGFPENILPRRLGVNVVIAIFGDFHQFWQISPILANFTNFWRQKCFSRKPML